MWLRGGGGYLGGLSGWSLNTREHHMTTSNIQGITLSLLLAVAAGCGGAPEVAAPGATAGAAVSAKAEPSVGGDDGSDRRGACPGDADFEGLGERVERQLNIARRAVCKYRRIEAALADGYTSSGLPCIPGQGYHYLKGSLIGTTDIRHPSALMYTADGRLTGPEWIAPESVFPTPPKVFGQTMHSEDELGLWILHVWVWELNSNGVFSDLNPTVTCP